jgi:20S proteasome alpha/beta subunit
MTLILALTCKDAVVMAADSQATETQGGNVLAGVRHDVEKLHQLGPNMLWGASGSVGVIQDIEDALGDWAAGNPGKLDDPARRIKPELVKVVAPVLKAAYANYIQVPGRQPNPPVTSMLLAGRTAGTRWILEIEENGGAEFKDGFAAIGSAYHYANVAAAMLKEYNASTRELIHGQLLALRVLDTAVAAAAFGVGGALRLAVVSPTGSKVLPAEEVAQARDLVDGWRQAEAETLEEFVLRRPDAAMVPDAPSDAEEATHSAS